MKFPVIAFTNNDKKMGSMNNFIVDKSMLKLKGEWNSNFQVIDSNGQLYFIKSLKQDGGVLIWESIKSICLRVRVIPIFFQEPSQLNFEELKVRISKHIERNKPFWSPLNDGRGLKNMIKETSTFEELIKMFR